MKEQVFNNHFIVERGSIGGKFDITEVSIRSRSNKSFYIHLIREKEKEAESV